MMTNHSQFIITLMKVMPWHGFFDACCMIFSLDLAVYRMKTATGTIFLG